MASLKQPVVIDARYFLAHVPGLVRYGSKPWREIPKEAGLLEEITSHLRSYEAAVSYLPNRVFLGGVYPDELNRYARPWFSLNSAGERWQPRGETMPEEEFYGLLKVCDLFDLVWLEEGFSERVKGLLEKHPFIGKSDLERFGEGQPMSTIEAQADGERALPLYLRDGEVIGCMRRAHDEDLSLRAEVLLENLACKATAVMAARALFGLGGFDPSKVDYILNTGEEATGDRYQRGGGNLAKAIGEMCGCAMATGADVKAYCCGPVHALIIAGSLVSSGLFKQVLVVGGASFAKLGMKFQGALKHDQPILEDVLAAMAILVGEDDGRSPIMRLDSVGRHTVEAGSSQQALLEKLVAEPLERLGLRFGDVDKYATEMHNPEVTEPQGSGNVPLLNYRLIGSLAALRGEISKEEVGRFVERHGMPGFSPTQGHIASAIPFLGHALDRMKDGGMKRAMFLAKGSLFLGRMTQMSDGVSFILEKHP
jgi:betaine reductase